ncbi:MAG: tetratricopeptide repeat protein [Thermoplasmata archaeon]|nr:MAG: tetratricopeptide repeat protein [Thermoplasmata archaeon]
MGRLQLTRIMVCFVIGYFLLLSYSTVLNNESETDFIVISNVEALAQDDRPTTMSGKLEIEMDMRFLGGSGGGKITVTLEGQVAKELRRRIDQPYYLSTAVSARNNSKVNGPLTGSGTEVAAFMEVFEDRLELNDINNIYDLTTNFDRSYNGVFAGIDITRKGGSEGVDITSETGLSDSSTSSVEPITIEIKFGGSLLDDPGGPLLTNGEIIFYCLFGYEPALWNLVNETQPDISCSETVKVFIVGWGSYTLQHTEGGDVFKLRIPGGEIIEYSQNYFIGDDSKSGYLLYESFNIIQSSVVLTIYGLIVSIIMLSLPRKFFISSGRTRRIKWIHFMGLGFFIVIIIMYFFGINGLLIWILAPLFMVVTGVVAKLCYKPVGDLSTKSPDYQPGEWHERGLEHYQKGEFEQALVCFERALERNMQDEIIWNDKGHVLRKLGQYPDALKCFNLALKINPDFDNAKRNKQLTLMDMRRQG